MPLTLSVIGCGYLGAVHATCMAELGHTVIGIDTDVAKGAAAVGLARRLGADPAAQAAAGLASCVGHSWPVFARFRGGKAVATAFGGLLMVSPEAAAWATFGGIGALALSRTMSVGSLTAAGTATLGAGLDSRRRRDVVPFVFTALASTLVIVRHAPNIRRIARGEEPQLSARLWGGRH